MKLIERIEPYAVLSVVIPFLVHLLTLAPSVTFFDSGEFLTAINSLGIAHSPGYPLFVNYAKPFTWLPFANIAFRVNIATAVSAAAACYGVYLILSHILDDEELIGGSKLATFIRKGVSLSCAAAFAFTPRLWLQSNHDKPYPLIAFISAMIFYLMLLWREKYRNGEEKSGYVYLGAFLCGLAFGAHQTIVLMVPAYAMLILTANWRYFLRLKEILLACAFFALGFSVHLHLPIRALRNPLLNWGNPQSLEQFLWNFLRKGYPIEKPVRDLDLLWQQMIAFNIPREFTWVGLALIIIGIAAFIKKRRDEILSYLLGVLVFWIVIVGHFNALPDLIFLTEEFFTPLYLLSTVFIGFGLFYLIKKGFAGLVTDKSRSLILVAVLLLIMTALPTTLCALNYYENDQHENYIAFDYATNTLRSLPQGSVLYTWGDSGAFPLWYIQGVEKMRPDLDILHTPHLVFDWYLDGFPHLFTRSVLRSVSPEYQAPESMLILAMQEHLPQRPVFIDFSTRYSVPLGDFSIEQHGICYRIDARRGLDLPPNNSVWDIYTLRGLYGDEMPFRDLDTGKAILIYANSRLESGESFLRAGRMGDAIQNMRIAVEISPDLREQVNQTLFSHGMSL